ELLQDANARLDLALLLLGGVIAAVLFEVAFFARGLDALGDLGSPFALKMLELGFAAVESLLRQPGFCVPSHVFSSKKRGRPCPHARVDDPGSRARRVTHMRNGLV